MHRRLNSILAGMRQDVAGAVSRELIVNACRLAGHSGRACTLDPVTIVHVFIVQILHGNTALTDLPHLLGLGVTASAICQARAHLPLEVFQAVLRGIVSAIIHDRKDRTVARPSHILGGRFQPFDAGHARTAPALWSAVGPTPRMRFSRSSSHGIVPCGDRVLD